MLTVVVNLARCTFAVTIVVCLAWPTKFIRTWVVSEIKPKWLFLPRQPEDKTFPPVSRYRMQAIHRCPTLTLEEWSDLYNPLDLVSSSSDRFHRALGTLFDQRTTHVGGRATNNFRLFDLTQPFASPLSESSGAGEWTKGHVISLLAFALHSTAILPRLGQIQRILDVGGIADLAQRWEACALLKSVPTFGIAEDNFGAPWASWLLRAPEKEELRRIGSAVKTLLTFPLPEPDQPTPKRGSEELLAALSALDDPSQSCPFIPPPPLLPPGHEGEKESLLSLRPLLVAYTLGATVKDISLLIRFEQSRKYEIKAVDLDGKPLSRLRAWYLQHCDIENSFHSWAQGRLGLARKKAAVP